MKNLTFFVLLVFKLASAGNVQSGCPQACYLIYAPVCGYDPKTDTYQTFSNDCFLNAENKCKKTNYIQKYSGECKQNTCQIGCTDEYNPVCAVNVNDNSSKTFPNPCSVEMENKCSENKVLYKVAYQGECQVCFACRCLDNRSVCAYSYNTASYKTFPCNCTLEAENTCPGDNSPRNNYDYRYDGECQCSIECPENYAPVCARSTVDGSYQTFQTNCSLEAELQCNPDSSGLVYQYDGQCRCPVFCTMQYDPVCAVNTETGEEVTFGNSCGLYAANECPENESETNEYRYSYLRDGECEQVPSCLQSCTREYRPVCACVSSGDCRTFSNECVLRSENECSQSLNYYEFKFEGECPTAESVKRRRSADKQRRMRTRRSSNLFKTVH